MHSLVYRSVASDSFNVSEIYKMLSDARNYNATHDITGCLLYHNHQFLQLLEGNENEVAKLFDRIKKDSRHHDIVTLIEDRDSERIFGEWSMAFHDYGQNGSSSYIKLKQIDDFFEKADAFTKPSKLAIPFFANVREILFG
nr:BLUF domain-containing protein [Allomuricauda sp.]